MALREKATNHYYKINFDLCAVRGLKVFVNFSVYNSTEERDKEKERQGKWTEFFQRLRENLQSQYDALIKAIDTKGLTPEQVLSQTEEGMIDSAKHSELRIMQNKLLNLEPFEQEIGDRLFKYSDDEKKTLIIPAKIKNELEGL